MSSDETQRRSSYGPNSPQIGAKGARTRQRIIDETLKLFEERGFHETLVDDIAERSGVSRATLYQYFESKDKIFQELMEECGGALHRVVRRLGPLGPTEQGFDNLHWWLGEWAWVFDKYATMFAQWSRVATTSDTVRPQVASFVEGYAGRVAKRLTSSGVSGVEPADTSTLLMLMVDRFSYYRYQGAAPGLTDEQLLDGLAVVAQLILFPETPAEVLAGIDLDVGEETPPVRWPAPVAPAPADRFAQLSPRARATVDRLLDAACRIFRLYSYHMATIDDVVKEAGVARGTFYKYFTDKPDLLTAVAEESLRVLPELIGRLGALRPGPDAGRELRSWLVEYEKAHARYIGLIRVWLEGRQLPEGVRDAGAAVGTHAADAFRSLLGGVTRDYPFNSTTASLALQALLERAPDGMTAETTPERRAEVTELLARLIERGFLNGAAAARTGTGRRPRRPSGRS